MANRDYCKLYKVEPLTTALSFYAKKYKFYNKRMVIKMKIIEGVKFGIKLYIGYIGMETLVYMMSNPKKVCDKFSKRAKHVKH